MGFLKAAGKFETLDPYRFSGVGLATIDSENVLTRAGDPTLLPGASRMIKSLLGLSHAPLLAVATNNPYEYYLGELRRQIGDIAQEMGFDEDRIPVLGGDEYPNKKTNPDMFLAAAEFHGVDPVNARHIDDQLLSFIGARMAGFGGGLLVQPDGPTEHLGVRLFRPVDHAARLALRAVEIPNAVRELITDGIAD